MQNKAKQRSPRIDGALWSMHKKRLGYWSGTLAEYCRMNSVSMQTLRLIRNTNTFDEYKEMLKRVYHPERNAMPASEPEEQITAEMILPDPEPPAVKEVNTGMSPYDRLSLDKASKAIEDLRITINMHKNQIEALTKVLEQMTEHMAHFDALFGDPMKLYRSIFIPMYNGIRACENDKEAERERERKLDGTLKTWR